ncbi:MAG: cold shock domain-containing protein [Candidatus Paceibacterota bacterium]
MEKGTIARLTDKGFGFISQEGKDKDLFFHANELQGITFDDLKEGEGVTFSITEGPKGLQATEVAKA